MPSQFECAPWGGVSEGRGTVREEAPPAIEAAFAESHGKKCSLTVSAGSY